MTDNIKICLIKKDKQYDITNILEKVQWSGDYKSVARKLDFSILTRVTDISISVGDFILFYVNNEKVFKGIVWETSIGSGGDSMSVLAYDNGIYLLKNNLAYNFKDTKAESIASKVCADLGITVGNIISTGVNITKLFLGVSAYEIIMTAYTEASKKTGKKYMCYIKDDKLYVEEKGKIKLNIGFEEGKNLIESNAKSTLENMINKVVIVDDKGNKKEEVKNDEWIKLCGSIQDVVQVQDGKDAKTEAQNKLKGVEKTHTLSGYGNTSCLTGYGVMVQDSYTKMNGLFYIDTDSHSWDNGEYKIDLEISLQNIMNEVSAGQEESEDSSSSNTTSSSDSNSSASSNNEKVNKVISLAKGKVGNRYVWGATGPNTFDCSGFTQWLYKQVGINIPRVSKDQSKYGKSVSRSNLQPGDLLFFNTSGSGVSHVGLYIGNGQMIHAANSKKGVRHDSITSGYYYNKFTNARRVL